MKALNPSFMVQELERTHKAQNTNIQMLFNLSVKRDLVLHASILYSAYEKADSY